MLIFIEL